MLLFNNNVLSDVCLLSALHSAFCFPLLRVYCKYSVYITLFPPDFVACLVFVQAEIREVVEFAEDLFITVMPEIEIPGHSQVLLLYVRV